MNESNAFPRKETKKPSQKADTDLLYTYLLERNRDALIEIIAYFHEADIADFIEQIEKDERTAFLEILGKDIDPKILPELEKNVRDDVLNQLGHEYLTTIILSLDTDDIVYLVENLSPDKRNDVLRCLETNDRISVEQCLEYPENTAGRIMQRKLVTSPETHSIGQVIDMVRGSDNLPDQFYEVIVVDILHRPIGVIPLSQVMGSSRETKLSDIMSPDFKSFSVDCSQSSVAYFFDQYHLLSAPITDESGSIVGVITTDDAMAVLKKDTEEDLLHLGGVGYEAISDNLWSIARKRIPWLGLNLATAVLASYVISFFSETIEHLVAVAILMPIVASMGGNAGTQTLTIAVRALATKKLTQTNMPRVVVREIFLGCINGIVFALLMAILEYIWFHNFKLSIVLAFAMIINMIVAGIAGILVPLGLQTCGADPANGSSVFVTTVTDVIGFLTFLGLATVFLF